MITPQRAAIQKRWRDKRKAEGKCTRCGHRPPEVNKVKCRECLDINAQQSKDRRDKLISKGVPYQRPNPPQRRKYVRRSFPVVRVNHNVIERDVEMIPLKFDPTRRCFVRAV